MQVISLAPPFPAKRASASNFAQTILYLSHIILNVEIYIVKCMIFFLKSCLFEKAINWSNICSTHCLALAAW